MWSSDYPFSICFTLFPRNHPHLHLPPSHWWPASLSCWICLLCQIRTQSSALSFLFTLISSALSSLHLNLPKLLAQLTRRTDFYFSLWFIKLEKTILWHPSFLSPYATPHPTCYPWEQTWCSLVQSFDKYFLSSKCQTLCCLIHNLGFKWLLAFALFSFLISSSCSILSISISSGKF